MREAIREHAQGWIAKVILALLIIPFALWGIDSYFSGDGKEKPAATVNKVEISQREIGSEPLSAIRFSRAQAAASRARRPWVSVTLIESSRSGFWLGRDMLENGC